jgi:hypothetical protein
MSRARRKLLLTIGAAANPPSGHVFRVERKRGPVWYAKYQLPDGRQVQKKLGPAWTSRGRPTADYFRPAILDGVISELDVIELRLPVGDWDAGTRGTVHEVRSDALLVEIADEDGVTRDLITVPVNAASVVWSMDEHRRSETPQDVSASRSARRRAAS